MRKSILVFILASLRSTWQVLEAFDRSIGTKKSLRQLVNKKKLVQIYKKNDKFIIIN